MINTFDYQKPTAQMLGRWQPWHPGHTALFKKALEVTGQVAIMVRDVHNINGDAGAGRTAEQTDNPFGEISVIEQIWLTKVIIMVINILLFAFLILWILAMVEVLVILLPNTTWAKIFMKSRQQKSGPSLEKMGNYKMRSKK